jgi:hypothetical protein
MMMHGLTNPKFMERSPYALTLNVFTIYRVLTLH